MSVFFKPPTLYLWFLWISPSWAFVPTANSARTGYASIIPEPRVARPLHAAVVDQEIVRFSMETVLDTITHSSVFWSVDVMLVIVGLLYTWEKGVEYLKEESPPFIQPVVDRVLGEMGGLGFIGLFVSTVLGQAALGGYVGKISETFLGESDILIDSFEFIHEAFFQAAMAYFFVAALIIYSVLYSIQVVADLADGSDCVVSGPPFLQGLSATNSVVSKELADILDAPSIQKASRIGRMLSESDPQMRISLQESYLRESAEAESSIWRELTLSKRERGGEILVLRERLKNEFDLPDDFKIYTYLQQAFATAQLDIVAISPLSWIPLIPAIALAGAVEIAHGVVTPAAPNVVQVAGFFLSTSWFFVPKLSIDLFNCAWAMLNFWKLSRIKALLLPKVVRLEGEEGMGQLLAPDMDKPQTLRIWLAQSTPFWILPLERYYGAPPENQVQELFGEVGGNGLQFYLNSIKYQTWLTVISLNGFAANILPQDIFSLTHLDQVTDPENLFAEICVFGSFAVLNVALLVVQPIVFLNYCLVACVDANVKEGFTRPETLKAVLGSDQAWIQSSKSGR